MGSSSTHRKGPCDPPAIHGFLIYNPKLLSAWPIPSGGCGFARVQVAASSRSAAAGVSFLGSHHYRNCPGPRQHVIIHVKARGLTPFISTVAGASGSFQYSYLPNSNLIENITGPTHTVANTWELTRNVLAAKENKVGTTVISGYTYNVNHLGQRTGVNKAGTAFASTRSIDWGYNAKGEVVKADSSVTGFDRAYQYDGIGNRLKSADSLTLPTSNNYTPNALNQYTAITQGSAGVSPAYDDDGNATAYPLPANPGSNSTLVWDAENRLSSTTVNSVTTTYFYDSQSRRIATVGTTTILYIYDGWNPIAEYEQSGTGILPVISKTYTWGMDLSGSMQGAGGVGGLLSVTSHFSLGTSHFFPTYDGNGNVSEYLDSTEAIAAHYEYDPFGKETVSNGTNPTGFAHRFSTKPVDSTTGLLYYGYRYYDPAAGRWPSRDPIEEEGGINLYGFVGNDGIDGIDILGAILGIGDGWSKKGTNAEETRRYWARKDKDVSLETLANLVKLDFKEFSKWARVEHPDKCGIDKEKTNCCFSVPRVYVMADALRGKSFIDKFINIGGTIGNLTTQGDFKKVVVKKGSNVVSTLDKYKGNLWGFAVFAHGRQDGEMSEGRNFKVDKPFANSQDIINALDANGFKLSKVYAMHCYSGFKGKWEGANYDWSDKWKWADSGRTFKGLNVALYDKE